MTTPLAPALDLSQFKPAQLPVLRLLMIVLAVLIAAVLVARRVRPASERLPVIAPLPAFRFTDQAGVPFGSDDLLASPASKGRVWIADFIFTSCAGPCPQMSAGMAQLQQSLAQWPEISFVSFSVDPQRDTPPVLRKYAERFGAGPGWRFLTGDRTDIYQLAVTGFLLTVVDQRVAAGRAVDAGIAAETPPTATRPADYDDMIVHSTQFALVDHLGRIRGYFDGTDAGAVRGLVRAAAALARDVRVPAAAAPLPAVNATLNGACTLLLLAALAAIRARRLELHRTLMLAAFSVSALFLASYLTYHLGFRAGATPFGQQGAVRYLYLAILLSHTVLAVAALPLILASLFLAFRGRFTAHRRVAQFALPVWLYVSFTGVIVFLMLYWVFPPPGLSL